MRSISQEFRFAEGSIDPEGERTIKSGLRKNVLVPLLIFNYTSYTIAPFAFSFYVMITKIHDDTMTYRRRLKNRLEITRAWRRWSYVWMTETLPAVFPWFDVNNVPPGRWIRAGLVRISTITSHWTFPTETFRRILATRGTESLFVFRVLRSTLFTINQLKSKFEIIGNVD